MARAAGFGIDASEGIVRYGIQMLRALHFLVPILWVMLAGPLHAQTSWTANPLADTFVTTGPTNNLVNNNYGTLGALEISGSGATRSGTFKGIFDSVLKFDLASAKTSFDAAYGAGLWAVQSVTLRLSTSTATGNAMFNSNSTGQFSIVWMANDAWAEGTGAVPADGLTYATLPNFLGAGDQAAGTFTFDNSANLVDGTTWTYDLAVGSGLSADALMGGLASFELLAATSGVSYLMNSSNFGTVNRRPLLTITAVAVPEPAGAGLLIGGGLLLAVARRVTKSRRSR